MTDNNSLDSAFLDRCANDPSGPVALHLREFLVPVEGKGQPFFPPTYAGEKASDNSRYNIDDLPDGTRVALVDSVGAQANRMEPIFLREPYSNLVPQVEIAYGAEKKGTAGTVSLLEVGHRLGDAIVRCTELQEEAQRGFVAFQRGDSTALAKLAPTSLVFGAWDSRDTGAKLPRIVQSVVRAWDVVELKRAAQYFPAVDYADLGVISEKVQKDAKSPEAQRGYAAVPSTDVPGGIVARGPIRRDVTINLVALRRLHAEEADKLRAYVLGLALIAAGEPQDPFLRQGCLLVPDTDQSAEWCIVQRSGERTRLEWSSERALAYAQAAAEEFGVGEGRSLRFDKKRAEADKKKKDSK